jgi:hypothetical protein
MDRLIAGAPMQMDIVIFEGRRMKKSARAQISGDLVRDW